MFLVDVNMATLRIETISGESIAEVTWADGQLHVASASDGVRLALERLVQDVLTEPTRVVSGGLADGQFVTTQTYVKARGEGALMVVAEVLVRKRISVEGQRLIPRMEGAL
jgi:hypothetical protein